jgi:hypothetical protein
MAKIRRAQARGEIVRCGSNGRIGLASRLLWVRASGSANRHARRDPFGDPGISSRIERGGRLTRTQS